MADPGSEVYAWLLSPLSREDFEREYYQRRVCVVRRDAPAYYRELLSIDDLDAVLTTHKLRQPGDLQLVRSDQELPASEYTFSSGVVDPLRAAKLFADGATLVFPHLQTRVPDLARLCTALGRVLSSRMQTNIYFTPAAAQGFKPHWDTHDVFVLQVSGRKRWAIHGTKISLPLRGQQFDAKKDATGEATEEFDLSAGDMVYIPRGVIHSARSAAEPSLHITTGLMAFTWADLFLQGVAAAALGDESLRQNLPLGFALADFPPSEKARLLQEKLGRIRAYLESDPPFSYFSEELLSHARPSFVGLLRQTAQLDRITLASTVHPRHDTVWDLRETDTHCLVRCYGNEIQFPRFLSPALRFALSGARFSVGEIPDCIDGPGKLTLVRRLVKEGLFECPDLTG